MNPTDETPPAPGLPETMLASPPATALDPVSAQLERERLLSLCALPLLCAVRRAHGFEAAEAEALTRALLDELAGAAAPLDPRQGALRRQLELRLADFVARWRRGDAAPGDLAAERTLGAPAELDALASGPSGEVLERAWALCLVERACDDLRATLVSAGEARRWELFAAVDLALEPPARAELGARLGLAPAQLVHELDLARGTLRRIVLRLVEEYARDAREAQAELAWILG